MPQAETRYDINSGQVIAPGRIKQGGQLLIVPFVAGTNVYATDALQRISLNIVKGLSETLNRQTDVFDILNGYDAQQADLVLKGKIVKIIQDKKFWQWFKAKKKILSVEGKLVEKESGKTLLIFSHGIESSKKDVTLEDLGVRMGTEIGHFVLGALN